MSPPTGGKLVSELEAWVARGPSLITSGEAASEAPPLFSPLATRSTSSRMVCAVGKRCAGSLRSERATSASTAGVTARFRLEGAGGCSCTCL